MTKKTDIWMPLYIGDYLKDTGHLDAARHGCYLLWLFHYWTKGPLPDHLGDLVNLGRLYGPDAPSIAQTLLAEFFTKNGDGRWHQKRTDAEIAQWNGKRQKNIEKALAAAAARWKDHAPSIPPGTPPSNPPGTPQAVLEQCPSPSPSPKDISEAKASSPRRAADGEKQPPREELIYRVYPRKVGLRAAVRAITNAVERVRKGEGSMPPIPDKLDAQKFLYRRAQAFQRSPCGQRPDKELIPHASTWFNESRYLDDDAEWEITGNRNEPVQPKLRLGGPEDDE